MTASIEWLGQATLDAVHKLQAGDPFTIGLVVLVLFILWLNW